jgi:hypothetical protein
MPKYYPGLRDVLPGMPKYYPGLRDILLISLLYWVSNCTGNMPKYYPGNMSKYYSTKYHYRNIHEV